VMITSLFLIVIAELLNSAIEWTIDDISLEKRPFAKRAKDMGSAAVFLAYINCIVVWGVILSANWGRIATLDFLTWPPPFLP
jgi:diacylglycerol kinase (ATP)